MNRNSEYIFNEKILGDKDHAKKAQVGVDLSIARIEKIEGEASFDKNSKLSGVKYKEAPFGFSGSTKVYELEPMTNYAITFQQGLETLKDNEWGLIVQRSSFLRAGCQVVSSIWDPGYGISAEEGMGTTLLTGNIPLKVPVGTRIAQLLIFDCEPVTKENLYNGRWQGTNNF